MDSDINDRAQGFVSHMVAIYHIESWWNCSTASTLFDDDVALKETTWEDGQNKLQGGEGEACDNCINQIAKKSKRDRIPTFTTFGGGKIMLTVF